MIPQHFCDERDGYAKNRLLGRREDDAEALLAKVSAVINPSDRVEIILRAEYTDSEVGGPPFVVTDDHPVPPLLLSTGNPGGILSVPGTLCGPLSCAEALGLQLSPPGVTSADPRNPYSTGGFNSERESYGLSGVLSWTLSEEVELKSITAYFEIDQDCPMQTRPPAAPSPNVGRRGPGGCRFATRADADLRSVWSLAAPNSAACHPELARRMAFELVVAGSGQAGTDRWFLEHRRGRSWRPAK